jgi:hypothetical protein
MQSDSSSHPILHTKSMHFCHLHTASELRNIGDFLTNHNLLLNVDKTNFFLNFKTPQNRKKEELIVNYSTDEIAMKNSINFLGLIIDQNLNCDDHIHNILSKMNSGVYALARMKDYCDIKP